MLHADAVTNAQRRSPSRLLLLRKRLIIAQSRRAGDDACTRKRMHAHRYILPAMTSATAKMVSVHPLLPWALLPLHHHTSRSIVSPRTSSHMPEPADRYLQCARPFEECAPSWRPSRSFMCAFDAAPSLQGAIACTVPRTRELPLEKSFVPERGHKAGSEKDSFRMSGGSPPAANVKSLSLALATPHAARSSLAYACAGRRSLALVSPVIRSLDFCKLDSSPIFLCVRPAGIRPAARRRGVSRASAL